AVSAHLVQPATGALDAIAPRARLGWIVQQAEDVLSHGRRVVGDRDEFGDGFGETAQGGGSHDHRLARGERGQQFDRDSSPSPIRADGNSRGVPHAVEISDIAEPFDAWQTLRPKMLERPLHPPDDRDLEAPKASVGANDLFQHPAHRPDVESVIVRDDERVPLRAQSGIGPGLDVGLRQNKERSQGRASNPAFFVQRRRRADVRGSPQPMLKSEVPAQGAPVREGVQFPLETRNGVSREVVMRVENDSRLWTRMSRKPNADRAIDDDDLRPEGQIARDAIAYRGAGSYPDRFRKFRQ